MWDCCYVVAFGNPFAARSLHGDSQRVDGLYFTQAFAWPEYDILEFGTYGNRAKFGKLYSK